MAGLVTILCVHIPACTQSPSACSTSAQCFAMETCQAGECVAASAMADMMVSRPDMNDMADPVDLAPPLEDMRTPDPPDLFEPDFTDPDRCQDGELCEDGMLCVEGRCVECTQDSECFERGFEQCVDQVCTGSDPPFDAIITPESDVLSWRHVHTQNNVASPKHLYMTDPFSVEAPSETQKQGSGNIAFISDQVAEVCQWRIWACSADDALGECLQAAQSPDFPAMAGAIEIQPISEDYKAFTLSSLLWNSPNPWTLIIEQFECQDFSAQETLLRRDWIESGSWMITVSDESGESVQKSYVLDFEG